MRTANAYLRCPRNDRSLLAKFAWQLRQSNLVWQKLNKQITNMGALSKIGAALGGSAAIIPGLSTAAAFGGDIYSAGQARRASSRQMDFQKEMSSTAHQREIKDLRLAGLNPILSGTGGRGASTPSGSQAKVPDFSKSVTTALNARQLVANIKQINASAEKIDAETANIKTELPRKTIEEQLMMRVLDMVEQLLPSSTTAKGTATKLQESVKGLYKKDPKAGPLHFKIKRNEKGKAADRKRRSRREKSKANFWEDLFNPQR